MLLSPRNPNEDYLKSPFHRLSLVILIEEKRLLRFMDSRVIEIA